MIAPQELVDRMFPYKKFPYGRPVITGEMMKKMACPFPPWEPKPPVAQQMENALNWILKESPIRVKITDKPREDWEARYSSPEDWGTFEEFVKSP